MHMKFTDLSLQEFVRSEFRVRGVEVKSITVRAYPGETILIAQVAHHLEEQAKRAASEIDSQIEGGFVIVRPFAEKQTSASPPEKLTVASERVTQLLELIYARSRASEAQPSISYIPDIAERLKLALAPRHTLIFGRRGVGKTALMLEARRQVEEKGNLAVWVNVQSIRSLGKVRCFLSVAQRLCRAALARQKHSSQTTILEASFLTSLHRVDELLQSADAHERVGLLAADLQQLFAELFTKTDCSTFIFLDDIHYMPIGEVPGFLDLVHGMCRDNNMWIKAAGIKHQTRWFSPDPPTGLQTGHDAALVDLDVTLEQPKKARAFLRRVLDGYAANAGATRVKDFLSGTAIDRLVLASGGVPRDFLTLCAEALQVARRRPKARTAGVQDVNNAAGQAMHAKQQELEDDAAAQKGRSDALVEALGEVRRFLLEEKHITFLRVDFQDKETHRDEYGLVQGLMDLRMLHIVSSSLSAKHAAGRRSEVYLLDLSQYSGSRLKQGLRVLDLEGDALVLRETRSAKKPRAGEAPLDLIDILREGPEFQLQRLNAATKVLRNGSGSAKFD